MKLSFAIKASGLVTLLRLLSFLIVNKTISTIAGPIGISLLGQYQNLQQVFLAIATGSTAQAATKEVAQNEGESEEIETALFQIILMGGALIVLVAIVFNEKLALLFLGSEKYSPIILAMSVLIVFNASNVINYAILNGKQDIKRWAISNTVQIFFSSLSVIFLIVTFNIEIGLIGFLIGHFLAYVSLRSIFKNDGLTKISFKIKYFYWVRIKRLLGLASLSAISMISVPVSLYLIRVNVSNQLGVIEAGLWQSVFYICITGQSILTSIFSVYLLPKLSAAQSMKESKIVMVRTLSLLVAIGVPGMLLVHAVREELLILVFNKDFIAAEVVVGWQLTGTLLKLFAWIVSFYLFARSDIKSLVLLELVFAVSFVWLTNVLIREFGLVGTGVAYSLNNFGYLVALLFFAFIKPKRDS